MFCTYTYTYMLYVCICCTYVYAVHTNAVLIDRQKYLALCTQVVFHGTDLFGNITTFEILRFMLNVLYIYGYVLSTWYLVHFEKNVETTEQNKNNNTNTPESRGPRAIPGCPPGS